MAKFGMYIIPVIVGLILVFGFLKKVPMFDTFMEGAKDGLKSSVSIIVPLVGLITAVSMLKASGALDVFTAAIEPLANLIKLPAQLLPLILLRPVSGSGALALADNLFSNYGVDSYIGRVGAVMMGSTETTFYAMAIYFGCVGVKKTRHTLPAAVSADITGYIVSLLIVSLFFGT